uniref:BTB domain-containing protein n=1 Tax=Eutreptiella gymnastica TaxID=73025 RepID=A0A7S4G6G2_9EUGL
MSTLSAAPIGSYIGSRRGVRNPSPSAPRRYEALPKVPVPPQQPLEGGDPVDFKRKPLGQDYNYRPRAGRRQKRSERLNKDELDDEIVRLNVGGTRVMALRSTLLARGANFFSGLLKGDIPACVDDEGYYFIDKDFESFQPVLEYLRTGKWQLYNCMYEQVRETAQFFAVDVPELLRDTTQNARNEFLMILNGACHRECPPRFNGGYFPNLDLYKLNFTGVDFQKCHLNNSAFTSCGFKKCLLDEASLGGCRFIDCVFENTKSLEGNCLLKNCKVKCRCYCGGKKGCAFSFMGLTFEKCEFFSGEEFERHPMLFKNCTFSQCYIMITLYNVGAVDIKFLDCKFTDCKIELMYSTSAQLGDRAPLDFVRSCLVKCRTESTKLIVIQAHEARPASGDATSTVYNL